MDHLPPVFSCWTFNQARKHIEWQNVMQLEFDALCKNHTWELIPTDQSQNIISSKWLYRIKGKLDGSIDNYKARLVTKIFNQCAGVDFYDTFILVVKSIIIHWSSPLQSNLIGLCVHLTLLVHFFKNVSRRGLYGTTSGVWTQDLSNPYMSS